MSFPVCKFFRSEQGCKFGNKCRYKHSDTSPFPAFSQSDHQQSRHNGPVRRFYSEQTSFSQKYCSSSGEHEASVRNQRYRPAENFPAHTEPSRVSRYNEGQVRYNTAESSLEEKFEELETVDRDGAVQTGFHSRLQQQGPQRKVCHYFARNGNCCFGSKCRFEHARFEHARAYPVPPRFQQGKDSPRSDQGGSSAVPSDDWAEREDWVRESRYPNEGFYHKAANPPKTGSAAPWESHYVRAPGHLRTDQYPESDRGHDRSECRHQDGERMQVSQAGIKSDKICQFFVRGWCVKGRRCRFLHPRHQRESAKEVDPETQHGEQQEEKSTSSPPEEQKEGSTSSQSKSPERSPVEQSSKSPDVQNPKATPKPRPPYVPQGTKKYRREEVDDVEGSRLRRTEIDQLVKRFPKNKVKVNRDCAEFFQCVVNFSPTDPDWPFDVKTFQLQVDIPSDYPFEMMTITLPAEQDLPETVRRYLEVSIEEWLDDREKQLADSGQVELVFRPFLRWLDRNIEDVVTEGLKQLKRELVAKAAGLQFISAKELQKQYPGPSSRHADDEESEDGDEDDGDDSESESQDEEDTSSEYEESGEEDELCNDDEKDEGDEKKSKKDRKPQQDKVKAMMADPERKGTEVSLKNLQLKESTATLYFEKICLLIHCERCKHAAEFMATPGRVNMVQCGKCSQTQTAVYRPAMAHHFSPVVGYLDLDACLPYDIILQNCNTIIACMNCSKDNKSRAVIVGQPQDQWCRVCHHKLRVATDGVRFTQLEPSKTPQSLKGLVKIVVPTRKRLPKDPAIQEGKPLPNFGTCKHYKKSYRWLRFPCCGKVYPCDVCHDSQEDHEMDFAHRMICGFCCKEQPFTVDRPCKGCDMNLTHVHTKHWEGGQGCRDKITMCRNDKQKYRNSSKTVSRHSQKVKEMQSKKRTKLRHV